MKFNPATDKHTWNAVYINGIWGLVDVNWGARSVLQKRGNFKYQLDEHFFLPDPHHFICEHFPENDQWQLLDRPVTLEEFENMPHTKPEFFKYGLEFVSHDTVIIYGQGEINVRLRYPANKVALNFNFRLKVESSEEEEYKGTKLIRYGMQGSIEGIVSLRFRLPAKGSYILIYMLQKRKIMCVIKCASIRWSRKKYRSQNHPPSHPVPPWTGDLAPISIGMVLRPTKRPPRSWPRTEKQSYR